MIEVAYDIETAYSNILDGIISVPVFKGSVPAGTMGNYVVINVESETGVQNNSRFMKNPVIIIEVVTVFQNAINTSVAWGILNEINEKVFNNPGSHNISIAGAQVYDVQEAGISTVQEEDATPRVYRVIKRFLNQTIQ